jgi:glycosyltransferase involved in cell wall biosynthesis
MQKVTLLQHIYRWALRCVLSLYYLLLKLFQLRAKKNIKGNIRVLSTGTFYSDQWLITHLRPIANAKNCTQVTMVASTPVPKINNVSGIYAPEWLQKILGKVGSRLIFFTWVALKERPEVLVGFHILVNGLFVALLAKIIGAKAVYICGGGPREVIGGGIETENRIFNKMGQPDLFIEKILIKAVDSMDLIVTMGTSAIEYFKNKGVDARFEIVPGGFDNDIFKPDKCIEKKYDLILIGRLSEVKRVDRFLESIKITKEVLPDISAVIVGDGPDKEYLEKLTEKLDLIKNVDFVGWQNNVDYWLKQSRCFVLTSDSEGLSQALIQAMMTGLPAVTSNVGDLGDLLKNGENGYLIDDLTSNNFSSAYIKLFQHSDCYKDFAKAALCASKKYSIFCVTSQWEDIFTSFLENSIKVS